MKIASALIIAGLAVTPALAAGSDADGRGPGHYAWIADPIIGPKSGMPTHRRVWIPDTPAIAMQGHAHWRWVSVVAVGPRSGAPISRRVLVNEQFSEK
jgi:hypothetical protein